MVIQQKCVNMGSKLPKWLTSHSYRQCSLGPSEAAIEKLSDIRRDDKLKPIWGSSMLMALA
jgi:hypothetical protein